MPQQPEEELEDLGQKPEAGQWLTFPFVSRFLEKLSESFPFCKLCREESVTAGLL
jgi:hypothetical protein